MRTSNRLIRNTGFVLISEIANKLFSFLFIAYAARVLGPGNFGVYALIGTVAFLISYLGNLGLAPMAIREIAKERTKFENLFNHILSIRMTLVILAYPLLVLAVNLLGYKEEVKYLLYIIGISTVFSTFSSSFRILYVAFERFKVPSLISILVSFLSSVTNIGVLYFGYGLKGIVLVLFGGSLLGAVISGIWIRKRFLKYKFVFNASIWKNLLFQSVPFSVISFFQQATMHINILFLSKLPGPLSGEVAMGYFSPASSVCRSTLIFPQSFGQAALPTVASNTWNLKMVEGIIEKSTKSLMSVIIFPLVLVTTFFPEQILSIIFGEQYLASTSALTILGWAYALQIFNAPVSVTLSASKEIKRFIPWALLVFGINLILAVPLIIYYSFIGAAVALLISKVVETILRHYLLQTIWGIGGLKTMESFLKVLLPMVLVFIIIFLARFIAVGTEVLFVLALILYFLCIFFVKDLREGIAILVNDFRKKTLGEPG